MVDSLASQTVAMIQLSTEEKERYKGCHVYLDFDSGFYTFPVSSFLLSFFLFESLLSFATIGVAFVGTPIDNFSAFILFYFGSHLHFFFGLPCGYILEGTYLALSCRWRPRASSSKHSLSHYHAPPSPSS